MQENQWNIIVLNSSIIFCLFQLCSVSYLIDVRLVSGEESRPFHQFLNQSCLDSPGIILRLYHASFVDWSNSKVCPFFPLFISIFPRLQGEFVPMRSPAPVPTSFFVLASLSSLIPADAAPPALRWAAAFQLWANALCLIFMQQLRNLNN